MVTDRAMNMVKRVNVAKWREHQFMSLVEMHFGVPVNGAQADGTGDILVELSNIVSWCSQNLRSRGRQKSKGQ
jgi:hypothetical protein